MLTSRVVPRRSPGRKFQTPTIHLDFWSYVLVVEDANTADILINHCCQGYRAMASFITQLFYSRSKSTIPIPSVKIHNVETEAEKSGRTLKYFLRLNHANHAIWSHSGRYNSLPSV